MADLVDARNPDGTPNFRTSNATERVGPVFRYPHNVGQPPFEKWVKFSAMTGRHVIRTKAVPERQEQDRALASVAMYLPTGALKTTTDLSWPDTPLGTFAGAAVEALAQDSNSFLGIKGGAGGLAGLKGNLDRVVAKITTVSTNSFQDALAALVAQKGLQFLTGIDAQEAQAAAFGVKANPRTEVIFEAQQYRTHSMDFTLIPRSQSEARAIDSIIHFFQFYSLPRYSAEESDFNIGAWMIGFPYEFTIEMQAGQPNGTNVDLNHINRIGRSVLTSVTVDHAAGGKTAFIKDDGEYYPVATTLSLVFKEVRLLARGDREIERFGNVNGDGPNIDNLDNLEDPRAF